MIAPTLRRCFLTSPAIKTPEKSCGSRRCLWLHRTIALVLRDVYLLRGSLPRVLAIFYWPALNMLNFGFLNFYLSKQSTGVGIISGVMIGAAILWEIMLRSQFGVLQPFLEELWSRNVGNIFVSPIRPWEYAFGMMLLSLLRMGTAMFFCVVLAKVFFDYSIFDLGLPLTGFAISLLITGWWFGLLQIALMLRYGPAAEWLAWMAAFAMSPFVAVFYPVDILPSWMQAVAWSMPPTYVFEGMRAIMANHGARLDYMLASFLLNLLFLALSLFVYLRTFEATRRNEGLLQIVSE